MPLKQIVWKNILKWWRRFGYLAAVFLLWTLICAVGLVGSNNCAWVGLNAAVVLYALSLPISIILRLDQAALQYSQGMSFPVEIIGLVYVFLNFTFIGALGGLLKWMKGEKEKPKKASAASPPLNGSANGSGKRDQVPKT